MQAVELGAKTFCFRHVEGMPGNACTQAPPPPLSSPRCFLGRVPAEPLLPLPAPSLLPPTVSLSAAGSVSSFGCGLCGPCNASVSLSAVPASVEESAVLKHLSLRKGQREMPCFLCQNQGQEGDTVLNRLQPLVATWSGVDSPEVCSEVSPHRLLQRRSAYAQPYGRLLGRHAKACA